MSRSGNLRSSIACIVAMVVAPLAVGDDGWTEPVPVMNRAKIALTYRATVAGDYLIVEAHHSPGWHTYAIDNRERAREASGKENPESELPTRIAVSGGAKVAGAWRQTPPEDMSQPDIHWYTWGFEGLARFAVPIEKIGTEDIVVTISAQSCDPSSCTMVKDLKIEITPSTRIEDDALNLLEGLAAVSSPADPSLKP